MCNFQKLKFDFYECLQGKHIEESLENQSEDWVTNIVQTFCGLKEIGIANGHGVMMKMPTMYKTCLIEIHDFAFTSLPDKLLLGISWNFGCTCIGQSKKLLSVWLRNWIAKTNYM